MTRLLRRWRLWTMLALVAALGAGGASFYRKNSAQAAGKLAAAPARQGEFLVIVKCRGELRARRSLQITAPLNVPQLRIVWLAQSSSMIKAGEPVVRFDPSSARQQLQEKDAALKQAQATLDRATAEARITAEQDRRDVANARYTVERAGMEASKADIVSRIQGEESRIDLGLAEQQLKVQEATVALHQASDGAKVAGLKRQLQKAMDEVALTKRRIDQMEIKAPLDGIIIYLPNYSQGWANAKPFKVGDQVWPGAGLAEIPDVSTLQMEARVDEMDRARVQVGCDARVRIDSIPELSIPAKVTFITPLTSLNLVEWTTRSFVGYAQFGKADPRLRPAMNGSMEVVVSRIPNAISIPAKAVFTRDGKPVVYLPARGGGYRATAVEILARNPDEVAVKGIAAGSMVTLTEPDRKERKL